MLGVGVPARNGPFVADVRRPPEEYIEYLLSRGADPSWLPPSGIPILEDALINCFSGAVVDAIARRVTPRKAFWIAAGLGDVRETRRYFDGRGVLRQAARRYRPDFVALRGYPPSPPGASDAYLIFEAAYIALLNQRFAVVDLLLEHGLDLNAQWLNMQLVGLFAANPMVSTVEYLLSRGADPHKRGLHPASTALELAAANLEHPHPHAESWRDMRRVYELCGGIDPDAVTRGYQERTVAPAVLRQDVVTSLQRAQVDAAALGHAAVEPLDLFVSLLRGGAMVPQFIRGAGTDMEALQRAMGPRLEHTPSALEGSGLPLSPALQSVLDAALAEATRRKAGYASALPVIVQLVADEAGAPAKLLTGAGGSLARLRESLANYHH